MVPARLSAAGSAGEYRGSVEAFQKCVQKRADWPEAQLNLGISCWNTADSEGAVKAFEAVLESSPDSVDALRGLASLAVERENFDQALDYQARLIEKGERSPSFSITPDCCSRRLANWTMPCASTGRLYRSVPSFRKHCSTWGTCCEGSASVIPPAAKGRSAAWKAN